jgi:hypothetical protein
MIVRRQIVKGTLVRVDAEDGRLTFEPVSEETGGTDKNADATADATAG